MRSPARPRRAALLVLVVSLLAALLATAPAHAQLKTEARQDVYGAINCPKLRTCPGIKVAWFDSGWGYLGQQKANGGGYALRLAAGTYHLQFTDQRPPYDVSKYAPTDLTVTVGTRDVLKNVTMQHGGAITGTARAGGKPLAGATIVAAKSRKQSFSTKANHKGQFAVGGLPAGKYCLFTYDRAKRHVGKCTWVGGVDYGQIKDTSVALRQRAGSLTVLVDTAADGNPPAPASTLTVTSKATGQWWTAKVRNGKAVFTGVYPSRYTYKYDGGGIWLESKGSVNGGNVRPNVMRFGNVRLTKRGGWITGSLVDASAPDFTLLPKGNEPGATVMLFAGNGRKLAQTTSDADGNFTLQGALQTQSALTIVVDPSSSSGGFMFGGADDGNKECQYGRAELGDQSVITGHETIVGDIPVARTPGQLGLCATPQARTHSARMSSSPQ